MALTDPPTVLVLRALGLGDLLTSVPHLRALRRAYPEHRLVLATPTALTPIVDLVGGVDEVLDTSGLGALRWDRPAPRLAVNLHGCGPESTRELLATRPEALFAHRHPDVPEIDGPDWCADVHEVERWARLLEYHAVHIERTDLDLPSPGDGPANSGTVVVHPGAAAPARRWPVDRYGAVAAAVAATGRRVVVTAGPDEVPLASAVAESGGSTRISVHAGLGLGDLAALVARADLVVCGDTGIGHLATAYRIPSVLLFGPTPPRWWGPPPQRPQHVVLWGGTVGDPHADHPDGGLLRIGVDRVVTAALSLLEEAPADEYHAS